MKQPHEEYHSLDITKNPERIKFPDYNAWNQIGELLEPEIKFSILEIKSNFPLTDCYLEYHFILTDNISKQLNIQLINLRKNFVFENGYYTAEVEKILETPKEHRLISFGFENKRDSESKAIIFYKIIYPEWPHHRGR